MEFSKAKQIYLDKAPKDHNIPCEANSSERMGGWVMRDKLNHHIGFVPTMYGDPSYIYHSTENKYIIEEM